MGLGLWERLGLSGRFLVSACALHERCVSDPLQSVFDAIWHGQDVYGSHMLPRGFLGH